jgi:hypothetical protein
VIRREWHAAPPGSADSPAFFLRFTARRTVWHHAAPMTPRASLLSIVAATFAAACGGAQQQQTTSASSPPPPSEQRQAEEDTGGMVIEGQLGFLSEQQLRGVLGPATNDLAACYNNRLTDNSYLAGRIELKFRIGRDGVPLWVIPLSSTIGDRPTEQCMIEHAMALHFPRPRGGETETTYPLELQGGDDARPATDWPTTRLDRAVNQHRAALERCTNGMTGPFAITLYAAPHGTVATAGVAVQNQQAAGATDCLVHEVTSWHVPDPGSWYAKTTITLQ